MAGLADVINNSPHLRWITAVVKRVAADKMVTLTYNSGGDFDEDVGDDNNVGSDIQNAACLDQYTPVVGDVVHALVFEDRGVLILGSGNSNTVSLPTMATPAETIVSATGGATWVEQDELWEPGVVRQEPGVVGCWFFSPADLAGLKDTELESVQLEITRLFGGRAQLLQHLNLNADDALVVEEGPRYQNQAPVVGVPTWIDIPIGWGSALIDGTIKGIGVTSDDTVSTYSTTARVRFQPLSIVTG